MTVQELIARARSQIGLRTRYTLGQGGFNPSLPRCARDGACDCSGFVAWCLGVPRKTSNPYYVQQNGGWMETSVLYRDAMSSYGFLEFTRTPQPGDLLVYPDLSGHQGHVGIISAAGTQADHRALRVIHCSMGNWRRVGDAVQETDASVFLRNAAIAARVAWVSHE